MADRTTEEVLRGALRNVLECPTLYELELARSALALPSDTTTLRAEVERLTAERDEAREGEALYKKRLFEKAAESQTWAGKAGDLAATVAERDREIALRDERIAMLEDAARHWHDLYEQRVAAPPAVPQTGGKK